MGKSLDFQIPDGGSWNARWKVSFLSLVFFVGWAASVGESCRTSSGRELGRLRRLGTK